MIDTNLHFAADLLPYPKASVRTQIAFPWFSQDEYDELRDLFSDGSRLPQTFTVWHDQAMVAFQVFRDQGLRITRVRLRPKEFELWCQQCRLDCDYRARQQFTKELLFKDLQDNKKSWHK